MIVTNNKEMIKLTVPQTKPMIMFLLKQSQTIKKILTLARSAPPTTTTKRLQKLLLKSLEVSVTPLDNFSLVVIKTLILLNF